MSMRLFPPSLAALFCLLPAISASAARDAHHDSQACEQLRRTYQNCGSKFRYQGGAFLLPLARETIALPCSDQRELSFPDRVDSMDMSSILALPYRSGPTPLPEQRQNWDPGRLRLDIFTKYIYGKDESAVRAQMRPVMFLEKKVLFNRRMGADRALERVAAELMRLRSNNAAVKKFVDNFLEKKNGSEIHGYLWRNVSGTQRLSSHSFGTAIDLVTKDGPQYWLWDERTKNPELARDGEAAYRDIHYVPTEAPRMPALVVKAFEDNGFIWGGKWNHYDTMHFEYRPEFFPELRIDCGDDR